jgi:hypothetical protein
MKSAWSGAVRILFGGIMAWGGVMHPGLLIDGEVVVSWVPFDF